MIRYDPDKWFGFHKLIQLKGSVTLTVLPRCIFASLLTAFVNWMDKVYFPKAPYAHQIFTFGLSFLIIMRTNLSYNRYWEGISQVIVMHSKWVDSMTQLLSFDELSKGAAGAAGPKFRERVVHIMTLMSAVAMLELQGEDDPESYQAIVPFKPGEKFDFYKNARDEDDDDENAELDIEELPVVGGMSDLEFRELMRANQEDAQVHYLMQKMVRMVSQRQQLGGVAAPPPIVSRIFQELSNGLLGFENAYKVARTPFPFPYAQIVQYLQLAFILSCPFVVVSYVDELALQMFFTFLGVFCFTSLNAVASELEDPFGRDANDLPLRFLHFQFVNKLNQLHRSQLTDADHEALRQDDPPAAQADTTAKVGVRPAPVSVQKQRVQALQALSAPASPGDFDEGVGSMMAELNLKVSASGGALMHQQALRDVFDSLDQNGNGVLDHDECRELCGKIGLIYSNEKFDHMMKKLDPDGDSQVSFDVFWAWFKKKHDKMVKKKLQISASAQTPQ